MAEDAAHYLELHKLHPKAVTLIVVAYKVLRENPGITGGEFAVWARVDSALARKAIRKARLIIEGVPAPSRRKAVVA